MFLFPLPEELDKELSLHSSATKTSITDLRPDVDYSVMLSSFSGSQESVPVSGQITSESSLPQIKCWRMKRYSGSPLSAGCVD